MTVTSDRFAVVSVDCDSVQNNLQQHLWTGICEVNVARVAEKCTPEPWLA